MNERHPERPSPFGVNIGKNIRHPEHREGSRRCLAMLDMTYVFGKQLVFDLEYNFRDKSKYCVGAWNLDRCAHGCAHRPQDAVSSKLQAPTQYLRVSYTDVYKIQGAQTAGTSSVEWAKRSARQTSHF